MKKIHFKGMEYIVSKVNLEEDELNFHWKNEQGKIYENFDQLKKELHRQGKVLQLAK